MGYTYSKTSIKKVKELIAILEPYANTWQEWTESGACFLSKTEIRIIQNYLMTGSHLESSLEFNISSSNAASILNRVKLILRRDASKFESWLTERLLEEHGIIKYTDQKDRFLHAPLIHLCIPNELKIQLRYLSEDNMEAILKNHSEQKLRSYWFINHQSIKELKEVLDQNDCLHLLK